MDGTLLDSEKVWEAGLHDLAAFHGGVLTAATRDAMVGASIGDSMLMLHADLGRTDLDPVASGDWLDVRMAELLSAGVPWRPGAAELLAEVRAAGVPVALVTATRRNLVEVCLLTLGEENFDAIVCADDVPETKPHPAPYLAAAALLGVDPARCVAVEDSRTGVASGVAAGCAVLAVPCEIALDGLGVPVVASLTDVDVAYLRGLVG